MRNLWTLLPHLCAQLNAIDAVPPPRGAARWCAYTLIDHYCKVILPALDVGVRGTLLDHYRPRAGIGVRIGPTPSIEEYRRGALSADPLFDGGVDEATHLDAHFAVCTIFYYSAGNVCSSPSPPLPPPWVPLLRPAATVHRYRLLPSVVAGGQGDFVSANHIQPERASTLGAHIGVLRMVAGDGHFGALLPCARGTRCFARVASGSAAWPPPTPHYVQHIVPAYREYILTCSGGGCTTPQMPPPPRSVCQQGGDAPSSATHAAAVDSEGDCVTYSRTSGRTYACRASDGEQWYVGTYTDRVAGEAAAWAFLRQILPGASAADCNLLAAAAQEAARRALLGRHGFAKWRTPSGGDQYRRRDLQVEWNGKKYWLCSVRTELGARAALDAFLSVAHISVEKGLIAAKQVALGEGEAPEQESFISSCNGEHPCTQSTLEHTSDVRLVPSCRRVHPCTKEAQADLQGRQLRSGPL